MEQAPHVMEVTRVGLLASVTSLLAQAIQDVQLYNENHPDFAMAVDHMERYLTRSLLLAVAWGFGAALTSSQRLDLVRRLAATTTVPLPPSLGGDETLLSFSVSVDSGEWQPWRDFVPTVEMESHKVLATDVVITTVDTVRHNNLLRSWLAMRRPVILCGPPGAGKTMILTDTLQVKGQGDVSEPPKKAHNRDSNQEKLLHDWFLPPLPPLPSTVYGGLGAGLAELFVCNVTGADLEDI